MWIEQYQRMLRARDWVKKNQKVVSHYAADYTILDDEYTDHAYSCIQHIHHFKDWLASSGVATKKEIDQFLEQNIDLKVCQDICNGVKHLTPQFKKEISLESKISPAPYLRKGGHSEFLIVHQIVISGSTHDSHELIDRGIEIWTAYLKAKGLVDRE